MASAEAYTAEQHGLAEARIRQINGHISAEGDYMTAEAEQALRQHAAREIADEQIAEMESQFNGSVSS